MIIIHYILIRTHNVVSRQGAALQEWVITINAKGQVNTIVRLSSPRGGSDYLFPGSEGKRPLKTPDLID